MADRQRMPAPGGPSGAIPFNKAPVEADDSGTDTDDEGRLIQQGKAAPKRPAGAITLRTLLDAGFLVPGCKVLYVEYKGIITWADLTEDGTIVCDGKSFESPSAFSITVKRKLNPDRKADDGWKAVKYAGKLLEHFKEQYLRQQLAAATEGGGLRGATPSGSVGPYGSAGATGPSPGSSGPPSPLRPGDADGPPNKRQRVDGEGDGGNAGARPGLKIKLKLKEAAEPEFTGPLMPLPAPPLAQVACGAYSGVAGSGEPGAQPFRLEVSEMVVIVLDFHAHCCSAEVGGLLGGTYSAATRTLSVSRAFPVLELAQPVSPAEAGGNRPAVAVEFDPVDLARVREVIRKWGLQCVGSYRSHPAYSATPNALDVRYAVRAQQDVRTPTGAEPCVCAVVSPYDTESTSAPSSAITWFHVEYDRSKPMPPLPQMSGAPPPPGCRPMALAVETPENSSAHEHIMNLVGTQFQHTARTYAVRPTRAPMALSWRPADQQPADGRPETCLDKLVGSVVSRLPELFEGDMRATYGSMVRDMVRHEWAQADQAGRARAGRGGDDGEGLAAGRSRRPPKPNGALAAAARFDSDEEETEEEEGDEVQVDAEEEAAAEADED
ncbi:hypothetical protein GPECTOR_33g604 [Gonium pectorale]|uniref:RAMA domain-containing protein n=1 Tax=Gonium pectorale TaxID=33097 RepID=A0A150GD11_GONPE|nr:hypothetical protein GPECTOR_33g604 [Gonium pectorale]|eukprot:KXZ47722.1 hypothetical protein GPECTOR_33g604 [Gonium pectorale]